MAPRTLSLIQTGETWGGVLGQMPAGVDRTFSAFAYDVDGNLLFSGQATGVTLVAGQTAVVSVLLQQATPPPPFENRVPRITSLVASPLTVDPGDTVALQAEASDADAGDTLTAQWTASAGTLASATSLSTTWTAPAEPSSVSFTLTVTDSRGASASASFTLTVRANGLGSAEVSLGFNAWPQVGGITSSLSNLEVGQTTTLTATVTDEDGNAPTYQWEAGCAGTLEGATSATARFTPSARPPEENGCARCPLTLTVADGRGGQGRGTLLLCIGPGATATYPPEVVDTYQGASTVPGGTAVTLRVGARDPQGSPLGFAWTASVGTLSPATPGASTSEVTWTAPACVPEGTTPQVTATVTNALGLSVSHAFSLSVSSLCAP
jgi:hypothetical protein